MNPKELLEFLQSTPTVIVVVAFGLYLLKIFLEKRIEGIAGRFEEIAKASLQIKSEIRTEERGELVAFRVAVEKWEDFLQTVVFDYTMSAPSASDISLMYKKDKELYLDVKLAVVRVGIYLRDKELEQQLMGAVMMLRKSYYPIINEPMPRLIEIHVRLKAIEFKQAAFEKSLCTDLSFAPTEKEREESAALQKQMSEEMQRFSEKLLKEYRGIAEQIVALKESMNKYIYAPIKKAAIDGD